MRTSICVIALLTGAPAFAESSLGITGASLSFGGLQDESGTVQPYTRATVDVALTGAHGLQGDLSFADKPSGLIGRLAAHLYMDPVPGQKYGLFLSMSDVDGRSLNWVSAGVEGQLQLSDDVVVEGRTGLGKADQDGLDYIFGGVSVGYALTPSIELGASLDIADFDEAAFRATSVETGFTALYSPEGQPWGVYGEVVRSDLLGRNGGEASTRIGIGLSISFGNTGGVSTAGRPFRDHDAVSALVRRALF